MNHLLTSTLPKSLLFLCLVFKYHCNILLPQFYLGQKDPVSETEPIDVRGIRQCIHKASSSSANMNFPIADTIIRITRKSLLQQTNSYISRGGPSSSVAKSSIMWSSIHIVAFLDLHHFIYASRVIISRSSLKARTHHLYLDRYLARI